MYVPAHFAADDTEVRELLTQHGAADLITAAASGLTATLLPFVYEPTVGEHGALLGHVARNNGHWRQQVLGEAPVIVRGPDAYVSPSWYASKAEHGRASCRRGTTSRRTSTAGWSCTTTRTGSARLSAG